PVAATFCRRHPVSGTVTSLKQERRHIVGRWRGGTVGIPHPTSSGFGMTIDSHTSMPMRSLFLQPPLVGMNARPTMSLRARPPPLHCSAPKAHPPPRRGPSDWWTFLHSSITPLLHD